MKWPKRPKTRSTATENITMSIGDIEPPFKKTTIHYRDFLGSFAFHLSNIENANK